MSAPTIQLDAKGNGKFTVRADAPGTATLTVSTATVVGGHTQSFTFNFIVTDDVLSIAPADLAFVLINTDQTLTVHWEKAGVPQVNQPLNLAATVGTVSAATVLTNDKGDATFTTRSPVAGDTLVTASIANGLNAQIGFTFVDNFSSIQLATPHYTVNEADGKAILLLTRAGSLRGAVTVDYQTVDGTAVANTDYTPASGMVTWADGDMLQKVVEIPLLATLQLADPKTFTVVLSKVTGFAVLGTTAQTSVTIINAPGSGAGSLQFTTGEFTAKESDGLATISVERIGGNKNAVSVSYTTRDGTAIAGQDYTLMQGSLNWVAGDAQPKTFAVPILSDEEVESVETLSLNLNNPTGGANLGARALATLRIIDSLGTPTTPMTDLPGVVQFEADNYQVAENAGNITLTVTRTQGSRGVVTVHYSTQEDTATNADFIGTAGDLRWLDGEASSQTIKIGLFDNASIDSTRKFIVKLTNLVGGDKLGDNAKTIVSIEDDDATSLHFSKADYVVNEDIPKATLTVVREGGNVGTVSVDYATMGDCSTKSCATAGQDYTAVTGTLTWVSGDTTDKTFTVPLLDDRDIEGTESIALSLTNATGNASLGTLSEATLTLLDNDATDCKPAAVIDCYLRNQGTLRDIKITQYGTVEGGKVGGQVTTDGVLKDVTFLAKARITGGVFGGIVRGVIESDPVDPAILNNVSINKVGTEDTILKNIIVGRGSTVDSDILLQEGVRFEDNSLIPSVADLAEILGKIHTPELSLDAINLTNDVLLNSAVDGILGAINGLYDLASEGFVLTQNSQNGHLQLDIEQFHYAVLPVQVTQILRKQATEYIPMGMSVHPDGEVNFITHTGREIRTFPVVQAPLALQESLKSLGYESFTLLANGSLQVPANGRNYFSARPSLFATDLDTNLPLGLSSTDCEWLLGLPAVYLIYDVEGQLRQQFFYPAAADPDALYVLAGESQTVLENGGRAFVHTGNGIDKHSYRGYFDYLVKPGAEPSGRRARIDVTDDVNQDGLPDYLVTYPNGDRQILFQLP
ncbi:MAG: hypothetical protein BWK79_11185 [Beggiatoa sp. IS2]|nr:MAG: hypothetical protein BWK79_11185 [Beggiatoa sp. IS2]